MNRRFYCFAAILSLTSGCAPMLETPTIDQVRAARANAPRPPEVVQKPVLPALETTVDLPGSAAGALAQIGPAAIPSLKTALADPNPQVRRQAARALGKMGPEAAPSVAELTATLNDPDPTVRDAAIRALGQIGPASAPAINALIEALEEPPPVVEGPLLDDGES
jgi:HEAT repeat protein